MKIKIEAEADFYDEYQDIKDMMLFRDMRSKLYEAQTMVYNKRKWDDENMSDEMYDFLVELEQVLIWDGD